MDNESACASLPDFEVRYRFYNAEEGGRANGQPLQGFRCDWRYEEDDIGGTELYMIWPEFLDKQGSPLPAGTPVPASGMAEMTILSPEMRTHVHRRRIKVRVRGYLMEGSRRVAEAVVTRLLAVAAERDGEI
jgi:hypothetical protein